MNIDIATTKTIAKFVVGRSVSAVIVTALHNTCPTYTKTQKVQLYVGAYVVGSMVADAARNYTDTKIDEIASAVTEFKTKRNANK